MKALSFIAFALSLLCAAVPGRAQESSSSRLTASVDVSVVDVTVVVRNRDGEPVHGLAREDFILSVDGIAQEITNFSEYRQVATPPPAAPAPKPEQPASVATAAEASAPTAGRNRVVIFVDNLHLHPGNRKRVLKQVKSFLADVIAGGGSEAMVVAFDRELKTLQRFTASQSSLDKAIDRSAKSSGGALLRARDRERNQETLASMFGRDAARQEGIAGGSSDSIRYSQAMQVSRSLIETEEDDLVRSIRGLMSVVEFLSGIEGRKAIVYISEGITTMPGSEVFAFLDQAFPQAQYHLDALNYDKLDLFKELTEACNANGVTLYPISANGLDSGASARQARTWDPSGRGAGTERLGLDVRAAANLLADDTGGIAIASTNQIRAGLRRIQDDFESYYSLGFGTPTDYRKEHRLEVELVKAAPGTDVRVRRGFRSFTTEVLTERGVVSRLSLPRDENPLDVDLAAEATENDHGEAIVALTAQIPWKNLALIPNGPDEYLGEIEAYIAVMDQDGKMSPVQRLNQPIVLPAKYYDAAQAESYSYVIELPIKPGRWTISVGLRDVTSNSTSYLRLSRSIGWSG